MAALTARTDDNYGNKEVAALSRGTLGIELELLERKEKEKKISELYLATVC